MNGDGSSSAPGELAVLDDLRGSAKIAALAGLMFVAGVVILPVLVWNGVYFWAAWMLGVMVLVIGGGLLLQLGPRYFRRNTPFLVIGPTGFRCPGLATPLVPWTAIDRARVSDNPIVCTDFFFNEGAVLPVRDRSRANVQVSRRLRQLSIRGPAPRGMSLQAYAAAIAAAIEGEAIEAGNPGATG